MNGLQLSTSGFVPNSETGGGHANLFSSAITVDRDLPAAWHLSSSATYSSMNQWRSGDEFPDGLAGAYFNSALLADSDFRVSIFPGAAPYCACLAEPYDSRSAEDSVGDFPQLCS